MSKDQNHRKHWAILAPLGLVLVGAGLSMAIDAGMQRMQGAETLNWVIYGTFALVVFNSGLCVFGQAVIHKVKEDK